MKIAVYSFGLNEEANIGGWYDSCREGADFITFMDSGPRNTIQALSDHIGRTKRHCQAIRYHEASIRPWRFDIAHNTALALVPPDMDICIPLHMDERLQPGWREELEKAWAEKPFHKAFYDYQFAPELTFRQNRIHARHNFVWRFPAHEGVYRSDLQEPEVVANTDLKIVQTQDHSVDRMGRDLFLLELAVREHPDSARMQFYYGRQLMYAGRYQDAVGHLARYLTMPDRWPGEAAQCADALAICYRYGAR